MFKKKTNIHRCISIFLISHVHIYTPAWSDSALKMLSASAATSRHFTDQRLVTFAAQTDVGGRRRLQPAARLPGVGHGTLAGHVTPENLPVGVPEVLRQEGVDDGVDGGVAVGQTVSHHPEHEGGLVQGERAKLHPQVHDVVRQPGQTEDHDHHQDGLSRLRRRRKRRNIT